MKEALGNIQKNWRQRARGTYSKFQNNRIVRKENLFSGRNKGRNLSIKDGVNQEKQIDNMGIEEIQMKNDITPWLSDEQ